MSEVKENPNSGVNIPELVLPPPIPVRPPKYTYAEYEAEYAPIKEEYEGLNADAEKLMQEILDFKAEMKEIRDNKSIPKKDRDEKIKTIKEDIENLIERRNRIIEKAKEVINAWRSEQRRRWEHGWADLVGIHYFYLTQMKIKNAEGNMIRPYWRDGDELVLREFMDCIENEQDFYVFKRREFGLSSIFGGLIPIWMSIMFSGSTSLMTSADKPRVDELLKQKFISQLDALEDWVAPERKRYDTKNSEVILAEKDEDGKRTGNEATVRCRQTSQDKKDVGNMEGARAKYAFLDELFLHPYPEEVRGATQSCLMSGMERVGIMVAGGSAGLGSRLGMKQARRIWDSAQMGNVKALLLEGTLCITAATIRDKNGKKIGTENFCINGWSDVDRARAYIEWTRKVLDLNPDKRELNSFIKRYPLDIEEVFQSDEIGIIPKEIADMIPTQERELRDNPRNVRRMDVKDGKLIPNQDNGVFHMIEEPVVGEEYLMGTDPTPMNEASSESTDAEEANGSMFCSVIKRRSTNTYVGIYMRRSKHSELVHKEVSELQKLYNDCKNMVERNRGESFMDKYKSINGGDWKMLADQPVWIGAKGYKKGSLKGWYKGQNEDRALDATFDYFRMNMHNIEFDIILEQLRVFGIENCDVIDAIVSCEVYEKGIELTDGQKALKAMKAKYKHIPYIEYGRNGERHVRYRKVLQDGQEAIGAAAAGMTPIKGNDIMKGL